MTADFQLPAAPDMEAHVLSALMIDPDGEGWDTTGCTLTPSHFVSIRNQKIFGAITALRSENKIPDLITLLSHLRDTGDLEIVGESYLVGISTSIPTRAMLSQHAAELVEKKRLRDLNELSERLRRNAQSLIQSDEIISKTLNDLEDIGQQSTLTPNQTPAALQELLLQTERRQSGEESLGILTGISDLDRVIGGLQKGIFNVLCGTPSSGKTSLADQAVVNALIRRECVLYIGLEGGLPRVLGKMAAKLADLPYSGWAKGRYTASEYERFKNSAKSLASQKLILIRPHNLTADNLRSTIRQMWRKYGVTLVVIDYLQKIFAGSNPDRERTEIAAASKQFHAALIDCNIAGMALVQLNRESQKSERPCMYHIKGSGQVEQDADNILALWSDQNRETWNPIQPFPTICTVLKQKDDRLGDIPLLFDRRNLRFLCPERNHAITPYED